MMNKSRFDLLSQGYKPHFPVRELHRLQTSADGSISVVNYDEKSTSILRSRDFDVQTLLDTNPSLLKPVGAFHPDRLTESDQVSRYASMLSEQVPFDSVSSDLDSDSSSVE